jgi:hypothetical protein
MHELGHDMIDVDILALLTHLFELETGLGVDLELEDISECLPYHC